MTQISKRNLPLSVRLARNKEIATWWLFAAVALSGFSFLGFKFGERIGDNLSNRGETDNTIPTTFLPPISIPSSFIYSPFGFDKNEDAHTALRNDTGIVGKSFNQHTPAIREVRKITWKEDDSIVTPNAHRVLLPSKLTRALNDYCRNIGLTQLARSYIMTEESNIEPGGFRLVTLGDGNIWYAQRPGKEWKSDMHWVSPADEKGHEGYLKILTENGFLSVLNIIGNELGLDGLVAYQLTFIVVSHCEQGFMHHDTHNTGDRTYNVIIPLQTVEDSPPELIIQGTDEPVFSEGRLSYEKNIGIMIGDLAEHATSECDYRDNPGAMRLAATVYITDVNEDNVQAVAGNTLTQIFPRNDVDWLMAQRGRHWINAKYRSSDVHFVGDLGRDNLFSAADGEGCNGWKVEDPTFCETNLELRKICPVTCDLYLDGDFYESNFSTEPWLR